MLKSSELVSPVSFPFGRSASRSAVVTSDWAITVLLALVSVVPSLALWNRGSYLTGDSYQYLRAALTFAHGQGLQDMSGNPFTVLTPLYPLLIGILYRLIPAMDIETVARLVSLAGASTAVVAFYWLLRARYSLRLSFTAALLFALLPLRVWSGFWALSEGLYVGLVMLGVVLLFRPLRSYWLSAVLGGVLLGLAYLTRPEAILCVAGVAFLFLVKGQRGRKRALLILAGFLLVALPYHAWVYRETGSPSSGRLGPLFAQSQSLHEGNLSRVLLINQVKSDGSLVPQPGSDMTLSAIGRRYMFFARAEMGRLFYLLGPYFLVLALLIVGGVLSLSKTTVRKIRGFQFAAAWPFVLASWLLFLPFIHIEDRYLLQVMPAFLIWLVLIMVVIREVVETKLRPNAKPLAGFVSLALIAVFVLSYGYRLATQIPESDPSVLARRTARWLESEQRPPAPILSQNPDLAFFANGSHLWMPAGETADILNYARRKGANYIYVSTQDVPTPLNDMLLGNNSAVPDSLRLLHEESDGPLRGRLFEVKIN
jgi:4-amino-4-deoxy-L-arabinose transferase-like glycosyltransferase